MAAHDEKDAKVVQEPHCSVCNGLLVQKSPSVMVCNKCGNEERGD